MRLKRTLHGVLEGSPEAGRAGTIVNGGLFGLIAANVVVAIVGTVPEVERSLGAGLELFELLSVAVFGVETSRGSGSPRRTNATGRPSSAASASRPRRWP